MIGPRHSKILTIGALTLSVSLTLSGVALAAEPKIATGLPKASPERAASRDDLEDLRAKLTETEGKIATTEAEIKRIKDADFLPNLYFALADLYVEKSRVLYLIKIASNVGTPISELDFTAEKRPKQNAVEIYQKIYVFFTSFDRRDRALFYKAHELHDLGQQKQMVETYEQLMREFPDSPYWLESNLILGDFMLEEKKDVDGALTYYKKVLTKTTNPFTVVAHYRAGWCYINKNDYANAFHSFDSALDIYDKVDGSLLPDTYKQIDLRRETVLAIIFPYVELYADTTKNRIARGESPAAMVKRRSDTFLTYQKALGRIGRRLQVKDLHKEAAEAQLQLLQISEDPLARLDAALRYYDSFRKGKLADGHNLSLYQRQLVQVVHDLSSSNSRLSPQERAKNFRIFEAIMRDLATTLHRKAVESKKSDDFANAIDAYDNYEWAFPKSRFLLDMLINKAESEFNAKRWVDAGITYERVIEARGKNTKVKDRQDFAESALQSYSQALTDPNKLSPTHLLQARIGLREVGTAWLKRNPRGKTASTVQYNIMQSWYDERDFAHAIQAADQFIATYPISERLMGAVAVALNSFSQMDDYQGLARAGGRYSKLSGLKESDRENIRATVKAAQLKQVQAKAGEFGTKEYAQNLKNIAQQNKGTSLGDQALYEAFISLKSKRDAQTYEVGEQLLESHGDSQYAKEVAASMAQMAMTTADFERAARYFESFAVKYPKEKEASAWLQNSANIYQWLGEYGKARGLYQRLGDSDAAATMDLLANDWPSLAISARAVKGLKSQYWQALALVRQGQMTQATPLLQQIASRKPGVEERDMIAHASYLLSTETLTKFRSIRMANATDQQALQQKIELYQALMAQLKKVIQLQSGRWTIAALYGMGQANFSLAEFVANSPAPAGLTAQQKSEYTSEVKKQASGYYAEAGKFFGQCLSTAEEFEILTRFVDGCLARGKKEINEVDDTWMQAKTSRTKPAAAAGLRLKLYDQPRNTETLHALAKAYLDSGDYAMSAAIFRRILEIAPSNSRAQAGLGLAYLYMNDLDHGYDEMKKALKMNTSEPVALWNIAGLMNEFKFQKKRSAAIKKAKAVSKPALLHPFAQKI